MARGNFLQVTGLDKIKKMVKDLPKNLIEEVDAEMHAAANDFVNRAVDAAPVDEGVLKNGITSAKTGELEYEVTSASPYSAFVEWGTRARVQVPADLQQYAAQFRGKGDGTGAKQAIFDWCKRHGIPEDAWYPIFTKIMTEGITPQPFFFIQRAPVMEQLQKNLKPAIQKAFRK